MVAEKLLRVLYLNWAIIYDQFPYTSPPHPLIFHVVCTTTIQDIIQRRNPCKMCALCVKAFDVPNEPECLILLFTNLLQCVGV